MHFIVHAATAVPFLLMGYPLGALGCIAPDVGWLNHECRLAFGGWRPDLYLGTLEESDLRFYRLTHSLLLVAVVAFVSMPFALGMLVHIALDLPTHGGSCSQRPLWPLGWVWPEALRTKRHQW